MGYSGLGRPREDLGLVGWFEDWIDHEVDSYKFGISAAVMYAQVVMGHPRRHYTTDYATGPDGSPAPSWVGEQVAAMKQRLLAAGPKPGQLLAASDTEGNSRGHRVDNKGGATAPTAASSSIQGVAYTEEMAERDLAASMQKAFENVVLRQVTAAVAEAERALAHEASTAAEEAAGGAGTVSACGRGTAGGQCGRAGRSHVVIEGIALAGGAGLNVLMNHRLQRELGLPVHVPSAPCDTGMPIGLAWMVVPPPLRRRPRLWPARDGSDATAAAERQRAAALRRHRTTTSDTVFSGLRIFDGAALEQYAAIAAAGATRLRGATGGVARVAALLAEGHVVGVVRGRQELGPRALGHRSLLALPTTVEMRRTMNDIKDREWWRPVAPVVAAEHVGRVFNVPLQAAPTNATGGSVADGAEEAMAQPRLLVSPHMSFAPPLRPEMRAVAPAIWHHDGTARPQTVRAADDPWLHALLLAVAQRVESGLGMLINTSFNTRGKPMVNRADRALCMLCDLAGKGLDLVVIEDWLFTPDGACDVCTYAHAKGQLCDGRSRKCTNEAGMSSASILKRASAIAINGEADLREGRPAPGPFLPINRGHGARGFF